MCDVRYFVCCNLFRGYCSTFLYISLAVEDLEYFEFASPSLFVTVEVPWPISERHVFPSRATRNPQVSPWDLEWNFQKLLSCHYRWICAYRRNIICNVNFPGRIPRKPFWRKLHKSVIVGASIMSNLPPEVPPARIHSGNFCDVDIP